ncbi:MAG: serine/threonine-protein kinase [Kofleriaceae bacterium]
MEAGTTIGRYEVLRLLAAGGMGEIYLVRQHSTVPGFASLAVIKLLINSLSINPAFVQMFLEEARIASRLQHKNIVQVRDVAQHGGQYYMVMEYIPGHNLRELLGDTSILDRPLFSPRLGAELFADIASALGAAHAQHLVHRDISPNNLMISDEGVPKLIDFGVARAQSTTSLTKPGTLKGKFSYMAPEYVRSEAYDHRVDLFSLGVVMWETFTRRRLFRGPSAAEQIHQILEAPIPALDKVVPDFPHDLSTIVAAALERDPQRRISSAMLLADSLAEIARALPVGRDPTLRKWLERRIPDRLRERAQTDQLLATLPHGAPIPDFGTAFPNAGSVPSSYGNALHHDAHEEETGPREAVAAAPRRSSSPSSLPPGSGLAPGMGRTPGSTLAPRIAPAPALGPAPSHAPLTGPAPGQGPSPAPAPAPPAPSGRARSLPIVLGFLGGILAIVVGLLVLRGSSTDKGPSVAAGAAEGSLADAHRQLGLRAMAGGDLEQARREFAEAVRLGAGGDVTRLLELTTTQAKLAGTPDAAAAEPAPAEARAAAAVAEPAAPDEVVASAPSSVAPPGSGGSDGLDGSDGSEDDDAAAPPSRPSSRSVRSTPTRTRVARQPDVSVSVEPDVAPAPVPAPAPAPPAMATVTVTSAVPDAQVFVDQQLVGTAPRKLELTPEVEHVVVVKTRGGETLLTRPVRLAAGATTSFRVVARPAAAPPAAAPAVPAVKPARTPRVTSDGSVDAGARVVAACNACHARTGAASFGGRRYTRAQWERFFAGGLHDRYVGIGDQMGAGELSAARAFLRANAADSAEHQGAGIQE